MRLAKITCFNSLSFFFFIGVFWWINVEIPDVIIPFRQVVAASLLFSILYCKFFICWWWISSKEIIVKILGFIMLTVAVYLIIIFSYPVIYIVLPRFGVLFHDPSYEFSIVEFHTRVLTATAFSLVIGGGMVFLFRNLLKKSLLQKAGIQVKKLIDQIENMQQRVAVKHLSSHFIKNVISAIMGNLTVKNHSVSIDHLMGLSSLMHYAVEMQENNKAVLWSQEWEQVEQLVALAKLCNGEMSVIIKGELSGPKVTIPIGLLLMPVENALKYGSISKNTPLYLKVERQNKIWVFSVSNRFISQRRDIIASSNSGYILMQRCIDLGNWPIELRTVEEENWFTAFIIGDCYT